MTRWGKPEKLVELRTDSGKVAETQMAVLVKVDGNEVWLPKSQIRDYDGDFETITMTEWIALEKGLDDYVEEL